jgi:hypothetical protein
MIDAAMPTLPKKTTVAGDWSHQTRAQNAPQRKEKSRDCQSSKTARCRNRTDTRCLELIAVAPSHQPQH